MLVAGPKQPGLSHLSMRVWHANHIGLDANSIAWIFVCMMFLKLLGLAFVTCFVLSCYICARVLQPMIVK